MKKVSLSLLSAFVTAVALAQSRTTDVNIDVNKGGSSTGFFASPWVWVIGAIVFILLLVALLGGGSSRRTTVVDDGDRVVEKKTIIREDTDTDIV